MQFLRSVLGTGGGIKDFPYTLGEPYSTAWGSWTHYRGTSKEDGSAVSIFSLTGSNAQDARLIAARNGAKRLRTLTGAPYELQVRHPNILSFLHSTEVEKDETGAAKPTIYVVTEPVLPLSEMIKELGLEGTQRDEYYAWGLNQIAKAVSFLNNDCKLYKPMEVAKGDWTLVRRGPPHAIDSWGLGCLIQELFSASKLTRTEELRNTSSIPKTLLPDYQRLLGSLPTRRLNSAKLLENSEFFQNKLVDTIHFMDVLNLKDSVEKDAFFRKLPALAEQLPRPIVLRKLLPQLAAALEFGAAAAPALNSLLKLGSWLPPDKFSTTVLPTVTKLFASSDRAIRVGLLQNIETIGPALTPAVVDEQVFTHLASGFSDSSAFLRELTLKSMLLLAPKVDEEPAIRTNTTILLGNIARHLNDSFYDVSEIATRILPNLVVLTVDADQDVRNKAFQGTEVFLETVKDHYKQVRDSDRDTHGVKLSVLLASFSLSTQLAQVGAPGKAFSLLTKCAPAAANHAAPTRGIESAAAAAPPPTSGGNGWADDEPAINDVHGEEDDDKDGWDDLEEAEPPAALSRIQAAQQRPLGGGFSQRPPAAGTALSSHPPAGAGRAAAATAAGGGSTASQSSSDGWDEDEDPWASIAAPQPTSVKASAGATRAAAGGMGGGGAGAARGARPGQQAQHVSLGSMLGAAGGGSRGTTAGATAGTAAGSGTSSSGTAAGRGRGRAAPMKLGAQRIAK
eukprot:jgi/Mesen1/1487/ME000132S00434